MKCLQEVNELTTNVLFNYLNYRNNCQIVSNFLMSFFKNWQIYIVEHDVDVFRINFCSKIDRMNDTSFIITKEQLDDLAHTLECVIVPTIVEIEHNVLGDCECQM